MSQKPPTAVREVDPDLPNAARMYDFHLGGTHNFEPDRVLAARVAQVAPWVKDVALINRSWLRRVVGLLLDQGVRQFLDLGSGIPAAGSVHDLVRRRDPDARVVHVDYESVSVRHGRELLAGDAGAGMVWADVRDPRSVLDHPDVARLIDFGRPVGLLVCGLLLFVADEYDPAGLLATYRDACPAGSFLAISTMSRDDADPETARQLDDLLALYEGAGERIHPRDGATIEGWFAGTELVEPGVVPLDSWRPDGEASDSPARLLGYGGVGRV